MRYDNRKIMSLWAMLADLAVVLLCLIISYVVCDVVFGTLTASALVEFDEYVIIVILGYIFSYPICGNYHEFVTRGAGEEFVSVLKSQIVMLGVASVTLIITKNSMIESRYMYIVQFATTSVMIYVERLLLKKLLKRVYGSAKVATLVTLVAEYGHIETLLDNLADRWDYQIQGIIITDRNLVGSQIRGCQVVADADTMMDWIRKTPTDEVIMDFSRMDNVDSSVVEEMEDMGITVHISLPYLDKFKNYSEKVTVFKHYVALTLSAKNNSNYEKLFVKRIVDIIIGLIGTIISIPIIVIVAIPLYIESPGPIFFKQTRIGLNGRRFRIYKLRSMYPDAEVRKAELMAQNEMDGLMFKMKKDPRITKVGRFIRATSIDELPQFFNILKGDMSVVGTRPPTEEEFLQYKNHHRRRLSMKPGLTGLWQVSGRSDITDFEEVVRLDVRYIDTWSMMNDLKIILKTFKVVFLRAGSR